MCLLIFFINKHTEDRTRRTNKTAQQQQQAGSSNKEKTLYKYIIQQSETQWELNKEKNKMQK